MRRVERGESFTVTRNGVPVADLTPHDASATTRRQRFVPVESIAAGVAGLAAWGLDQFQAERTQLDDALDDRDVDRWLSAG